MLILTLIQGSRMTTALPTSTCDFHTVASKVTLGVDIQEADGESVEEGKVCFKRARPRRDVYHFGLHSTGQNQTLSEVSTRPGPGRTAASYGWTLEEKHKP